MIASLRGKVILKRANRVIVDVGGVGYELSVPLSSLEAVQDNGETFFYVHTALRENALELYGFVAPEEKSLFEMLITVSGIGPRTALAILSGTSPEGFRQAILSGNIQKLTAIPGIGKKSAERIVLELKEKIRKNVFPDACVPGTESTVSVEDDLISSLVNLGYKEKVAAAAARKVLKASDADLTLGEAVKAALKGLTV